MLVQRLVMLANSAGLKVAFKKGISVVWNAPAFAACTVVPKANNPPVRGNAVPPAKAALLVQFVPTRDRSVGNGNGESILTGGAIDS